MLKIEQVNIADIKPFERNAKEHPKEQIEQIKKSIAEFGMNDPIAIDENNVIIEGHGRLLALKAMRAETVPCIRLAHMSEEQKRAYILAHNKLTMNTGFDAEILALEFSDLKDMGFDLELTGFDASEVEKLFAGSDSAETTDDNFDADKTAAEIKTPISQRGDVWLLGKHRLMCGDSTSAEDVRILMDGSKARCIFTEMITRILIQFKVALVAYLGGVQGVFIFAHPLHTPCEASKYGLFIFNREISQRYGCKFIVHFSGGSDTDGVCKMPPHLFGIEGIPICYAGL